MTVPEQPRLMDPARVHGNRWHELDVPEIGGWTPELPVTVVMPYFQAAAAVEITLAALGAQTYPSHLIEVVIADDGSDPPLTNPRTPEGLQLEIVYQEDRGFGAPRARNAGARAAQGDIILFADCDMVPEPEWVEAHARWHHAASDLLTLGFRKHVDFDGISAEMVADAARRGGLEPLFAGRTIQRPEWIEFHMNRTSDLTSRDDDLFRIVTSGNMGIRREWFHEIGGFDESFTQWGAEDTELGYRAFARGSVLVPERGALAWHQGLGTTPDDAETVSLEQQRAKIAHLIAQRGFRRSVPGRSFTVPHVVVTVAVGDTSAADVTQTVERVLANRFHDLVVELDVDPAHPHREWLERQFQPDPRVTVGSGRDAAAIWPRSTLFVDIPPNAQVRDYAIDHLVDMSADTGVTEVPLADGSIVRAVWGRALQRARRLGGDHELAAELFDRSELDWRDVGLRSPGGALGGTGIGVSSRIRRAVNSPDSRVGKVWRQTRAIRSPGDAARVGRWFAGAVKQKVTSRSLTALPPVPTLSDAAGSVGSTAPTSDAALGAFVAVAGTVATRVLAASSRVLQVRGGLTEAVDHAGGHLDLLVLSAGAADGLRQEAETLDVPVVTIGEAASGAHDLAVPAAIDALRVNPVGWAYHAEEPVAMTPTKARVTSVPTLDGVVVSESDLEVPPGASFKRVTNLADALRFVTYVHDHPDLHSSNTDRAGRLVELSAYGIPVVAEELGDEVRTMLGDDFAEILTREAPQDLAARERRSVAARRAALRAHSLGARTNQLLEAAGLPTTPPPAVSIVLATNRPDYLDSILDAIDRQTYPALEAVVVLHGDGFPDEVERRIGLLACPVTIRRVDGARRLGEVLNEGVAAASGDLIAKLDDDDLYGAEHIWDLVLAHEYSGAQLVGKGAEFVYLAETDTTIRRFVARSETYTTTIGGGALLISRSDLRDAGGWRRVPGKVDRALVADVERASGRIYRTHGLGYVLNRHGRGHTWDEGDRYFLDQAEDQRPGLDLGFAGVTAD